MAKRIWKIVLLCMCSLGMLLGLASCNKTPKGYTGKSDYYQEKWELGQSMDIRSMVDFVQIDRDTGDIHFMKYDLKTSMAIYPLAEYTLTLTNGKEEIDMGTKFYFELMNIDAGDWKFIYQITESCDYKGTYEIPFKIIAPKLTVEMTIGETNSTYFYGKTYTFEEIMNGFNIYVGSYFPYTATFTQVVVGDIVKDLAGYDSYTFTDLGKHIFTFFVSSEDGQTYTQEIIINVVYDAIGHQYQYLMRAMDGVINVPLPEVYNDLKLNGNAFTDYTVNADGGIDITKAFLYEHPGLCQLSFLDEEGEQKCYNVYVITDKYGFEDGADYIGVAPTSSKKPVIEGVKAITSPTNGNGSYALSVKPTDWSVYFGIDSNYVKGVFADELVDALTFKVFTSQKMANKGVSAGIYLAWYYENNTGNQRPTGISYSNEDGYVLITFTRDGYNEWASVIDAPTTHNNQYCQFMLRLGNENAAGNIVWGSAAPFYLDDFIALKSYEVIAEDNLYTEDGTIEDYTVSYDGVANDIWVNGETGQITQTSGGFIVNAQALHFGKNAITFINAYGDRVEYRLNVYTRTVVDFENGATNYLGAAKTTTLTIEERVAGNKAAKFNETYEVYLVFSMDAKWLDYVFSDPTAKSISFKVYTNYPKYRTGGSFNNTWYKDANGKFQRTSWGWASSVNREDGYFNLTLTKAQYERWYNSLLAGVDVNGVTCEPNLKSDMYLSIGFYGEDDAVVKPGDTYIDDIVINAVPKDLACVVPYSGSSMGKTALESVELAPGNTALKVVRNDNEGYFVIGFDAAWLAQAFADENATAVSFKVYSEHPVYRTGGSYNNAWYKDADGKLQRTSWGFMSAPSKTDGYFLVTLSRKAYNSWLTAKGDVVSDMYLSIGFSQENGNVIRTGDTYIDDVRVRVIDKTATCIVGYSGSSAGDTMVDIVDRIPGDSAVLVSKADTEFYSVFGIDAAWLAEVFADANTTAVSFKLYSKYSTYRTGGSYNNSWYQDANGALQRTSWGFTAAPSYTDDYFLVRLSRNAYNAWLTAKGDVVSDMYLSIGFYGEGNAAVRADNFYIDDIVAVKN